MKAFKSIIWTSLFGAFPIMMIVLFLFIMNGCGTTIKVKGGTQNTATASGEVKQINEIVLKIDVSACDGVAPEDQGKCIKDVVSAMGNLVEMIKTFYCKTPECLGSKVPGEPGL